MEMLYVMGCLSERYLKELAVEIPQMDTTVLLVTFVGYQMQEVALKKNDNKELIVRLKPDVTEIEEVVITGYGKVDKRLSASATTSVKIDDILIPNALFDVVFKYAKLCDISDKRDFRKANDE